VKSALRKVRWSMRGKTVSSTLARPASMRSSAAGLTWPTSPGRFSSCHSYH
jgi:hypothetical protein